MLFSYVNQGVNKLLLWCFGPLCHFVVGNCTNWQLHSAPTGTEQIPIFSVAVVSVCDVQKFCTISASSNNQNLSGLCNCDRSPLCESSFGRHYWAPWLHWPDKRQDAVDFPSDLHNNKQQHKNYSVELHQLQWYWSLMQLYLKSPIEFIFYNLVWLYSARLFCCDIISRKKPCSMCFP